MNTIIKLTADIKKVCFTFFTLILITTYAEAQVPSYAMSNQTVSGVCLGAFTDSNVGTGLFSPGTYGNNENFTMTFCSGSSQPITFIFSVLDIKSGDFLKIYDGPNTSSPLLYNISNTNMGNLMVTSSGTCLTFVFTSDGSGNLFSPNGNWSAGFVCGTVNSNDIAADDCANAPSICDLNGYFGNTSSSYTPDTPGNMCGSCSLFDGSLENNSWIKFVANNDTVVFTVTLITCSENEGIQFGVYGGTNCNNFTLMTPISWTSVTAAPITPGGTFTVVATGLVPGQEYYIMIDGYGGDDCQYVIYGLSGIMLGASISPDQTICPGETAVIEITGSGTSPITWSSNPPDPSLAGQQNNATINVSPTQTTIYSAHIQETAGFCSVDTTLYTTVTVLPYNDPSCLTGLNCQIVKTDATTCPAPPNNTCNGTAVVNVSGGTGNYSYLWNDGNTSSTRNNLCAGTYSVTVTDLGSSIPSTNCSVTINGPDAPTFTLTPSSSCQNGSNGSVNLTIQSGQSPFTYIWSNSSTTQNLTNVPPGNYTVTVTDAAHCTASNSVTVGTLPSPNVNFSVTGTGCSPVTAYFQDLTDGTIVDWKWELGDGTIVNDLSQFSHVFTATTQVEYYWAKLWVQNDQGCSAELLMNNAVIVYPIPVAGIYANPTIVFLNENVNFTGSSGYAVNQWTWNFNYPDGPYVNYNTNTATNSYPDEGLYTVLLIVTNPAGCSDTATTQIEVIDIEIPNIFTPNNDGYNDYFKIKNIEKLQNTKVAIYNRWGKKIFEAENYQNDWNGENHADGTYYYVITLGGNSSFHGTVTILR